MANGTPKQVNGDCANKKLLSGYSTSNDDAESNVRILAGSSECKPASRRTRAEVCLCALLVLLLLITIVLALLLLCHYFPSSSLRPILSSHLAIDGGVCISDQCVKAAARILESVNASANPCEDFFEFSCGNWIKTHSIPDDDFEVGSFKDLGKEVMRALKDLLENEKEFVSDSTAAAKAREFYKLCTNETELLSTWSEVFQEAVKGLGGWPLLSKSHPREEDSDSDHFEWQSFGQSIEELYAKLVFNFSQGSLFQLNVEPDEKDTENYIVMMDQPSFFLQSRIFYLMPEAARMRDSYRSFLIALAKELGADAGEAERHMAKVLLFETKLAEISVPEEDRHNVTAMYNKLTVAELTRKVPKFKWSAFFSHLYPDGSIRSDTQVVIFCMEYLEKLNDVLAGYTHETIVDYLLWRWFAGESDSQKSDGMLRELPGRFFDIMAEYRFNSSGISSARGRPWKRCADVTNNLFPFATGLLYVNNYFDHAAKQEAQDMIRNLQHTFAEILEQEAWIEPVTRKLARQKVESMQIKIGYPDMLENVTAVDLFYKDFDIQPGNYFQTKFHVLKTISKRNFARLNKKVDAKEWFTGPAVVNGFYQPNFNEIVFPAAILQSMFYNKHNPKSLNYGGIGVVIGHEISHGFDDRGRQYDRKGNINEWWDLESLERFEKRAQCIENQYSTFTVWGKNVNGKLTKGENIADNGGLKQSFKAYRSWTAKHGPEKLLPGVPYNHDQLFFIAYAQIWCARVSEKALVRKLNSIHSPGPVRVKGPLVNFAEFSHAFSCPRNSAMNPSAEQKCSLW